MIEPLIASTILLPFVAAMLIPVCRYSPDIREAITLLIGVSLLTVVLQIFFITRVGISLEMEAFTVSDVLRVGFKVEPLGLLFACMASALWIVNSIYSIGYMRGNEEIHQTRFYVCLAIAIGAVMIIAFAGNLFTLFVGYELLTLVTYPLVTHKMNDQAKRSGRIYILLLLFSSTVFFLPAIFWTASIADTLDFTPGGILSGKIESSSAIILLSLFLFGIGKAALMPLHFWLPAAMVAPTPVSAMLHAVAVVKAGVFSILKIAIYIFGIDFLSSMDHIDWLIGLIVSSLLLGSLIAMTKDDLKSRLAYSTISQLAYIVLAAVLATELSIIGGGLHIITHAFGKITLFFCAGAIYVATRKTVISELDGLGRIMPLTFACFFIGTLSIIGLPPLGGMWSKWYLALGVLQSDKLLLLGVLMLSSLLNAIYLLPISFRAFFCPVSGLSGFSPRIHEAPLPCLIAIGVSVAGCFLLFFFPHLVIDLMKMIEYR